MHWTTFVSTAEIHRQPPTMAITWPPSSTSIVEMTFPRAGSIFETLVSKWFETQTSPKAAVTNRGSSPTRISRPRALVDRIARPAGGGECHDQHGNGGEDPATGRHVPRA